MSDIWTLIRVFGYLSLLTVGGGMAAFPELQSLSVDTYHWLSFTQLVHLYSVGQLSPGPNMMMIIPIGDWVAGPVGAIVVALAFFGPTAILTYVVGIWWGKLAAWPWRSSIQKGLAPVSIGLLLAGCASIAKGAIIGWETALIAITVLCVLMVSKVNPAVVVLAGAAVGMIFLN